MAKRFDTNYQVKRKDNLADPDYWNGRLRDLDRRIDAAETALESLDSVATRVEGVALDRINNVVTPLVVETVTRLQAIANLFTATSVSEVDIGTGLRTFIIAEGERNTFAAVEWVTAHPLGDDTRGVTGSRVSYDPASGALVLDVQRAVGIGTFNAWRLSASLPPDLTTLEVLRGGIDGSRDTLKKLSDALDTLLTLEASARAEAIVSEESARTLAIAAEATARDAAIADAIAALKGGVASAYDTLKEIADWIAADETAEAAITTALAARLRVDVNSQGLTAPQIANALTNLGLSSDLRSLLGAANYAAARALLLTGAQQDIGSGAVVGGTRATYSVWASNNTDIPFDDSIPQIGEGTQILIATYTPKRVGNKLRLRVDGNFLLSTSTALVIAAFVSGVSDAICAKPVHAPGGILVCDIGIEGELTVADLSAKTLTVRIGVPSGSGATWYINGTNANRLMGGAAAWSLVVEEIAQ